MAKLKKADIASEAGRLAEGTGRMPSILKAEGPQKVAVEDAEVMATDEPAEALAA